MLTELKNLSAIRANLARMLLTALASIALCGMFLNTAYALHLGGISQVYFFGDSLTDGGFNDLWPTQGNPPDMPPLPPGKAPTLTTFGGYTWAQYVARDLKGFVLPIYPGPNPPDTITNNSFYAAPPHVPGFVSGTLNGINYAAGGSTTNSTGLSLPWAPSLHLQINQYLMTHGQVADPHAIYFIWSGANDLLKLLITMPSRFELLAAANNATINIANDIALLSLLGAKRVVVLSLPNIGLTPLITRLSTSLNMPTLPGDIKTLSFTFNSMLNTQLGRVTAQYGTKILYIDVYSLLDKIVNLTKAGLPFTVAGQVFKFSNYSDTACPTVPSAIYCPSNAPTDYIFADSIHPTDMAHRALSLVVETEVLNWIYST